MKSVFVLPVVLAAAILCDSAHAWRPATTPRPRPAPVSRGAERGTLVHGEGSSARRLSHDQQVLRGVAQQNANEACESGSAIREGKWEVDQESGVSDGTTECERDSFSGRVRCTHSEPKEWMVTKVSAWFRCE